MKKFLITVASLILCFVFSGCNVLEMDTEALMKPPVFTEEQEKLNAALTEVIGESYVLRYPKTGELNSAFIFKDLDGDGTEEAMAFYSVYDESTRINILKKTDKSWVSVYEAAGFYGDIESVNFAKIDKKGSAVVIKWEQEVGVYRYKNERLENVHNDSCDTAEITDIDGDGTNEIVIIIKSPMGRNSLKIVYSNGNEVFVTDDVSAHADSSRIFSKVSGKICEGKNMFFIDSEIYEGVYLTEMFALEGDEVKRYFIADFYKYENENEKGQSEVNIAGGSYGERGVLLRNAKVPCMDINGDGIIEMPVEVRKDSAQEKSSEIFFLQYMQYNGENSVPAWNGVANVENGYLFSVPESWNKKISVQYGSSADSFVFTNIKTGEAVLEIFAVSKNDYQDKYEDYVFVAEDETKNYYVKLPGDEENEFYIAPEIISESFIFM